MKPDLVFVYGTLKRGFCNHHVMERAGGRFLGEATTLRTFPLVVDGLPYLLDRPGEGLQVEGEIYQVTEAGWKLLDRLEGHPSFYYRRVESFRVNDFGVEAWTYFLARENAYLRGLTPASCFTRSLAALS